MGCNKDPVLQHSNTPIISSIFIKRICRLSIINPFRIILYSNVVVNTNTKKNHFATFFTILKKDLENNPSAADEHDALYLCPVLLGDDVLSVIREADKMVVHTQLTW
jgi:hypothetical protein